MKPGVIAIIVTVLALVGLGFFQYQQVQSGASQSGASLSALSTSFSTSLNQQDADISQVESLLSVLSQASALNALDDTFFQSENFKVLRDFYVTLRNAENIGRPNPFLGINEGAQSNTSVSNPIILNADSSNPVGAVNTTGEQTQQTDEEIIESVILDPNQASANFVVNQPTTSGSPQSTTLECDFENNESCFEQFNEVDTN